MTKRYRVRWNIHSLSPTYSGDYILDKMTYDDLRVGSIFKSEGKIWRVIKRLADGSMEVILRDEEEEYGYEETNVLDE